MRCYITKHFKIKNHKKLFHTGVTQHEFKYVTKLICYFIIKMYIGIKRRVSLSSMQNMDYTDLRKITCMQEETSTKNTCKLI